MRTTEDVFYLAGKAGLLPAALGAIFLRWLGRDGLSVFPSCLFFRVTGLYCPGCGGTRAAYALACGQIGRALWYHPAVPYMAAVYAAFMAVCFYRRHLAAPGRTWKPIRIERFLYGAAALLLLQCAVKNILLVGFGFAWL